MPPLNAKRVQLGGLQQQLQGQLATDDQYHQRQLRRRLRREKSDSNLVRMPGGIDDHTHYHSAVVVELAAESLGECKVGRVVLG